MTLLCSLQASFELCWSALLCFNLLHFVPVCSGLRWSALLCSGQMSSVFQLSQGNAVFRLWWKGKVGQSQRGAGLYGYKSLSLFPDWPVLMQMKTQNPCNQICPDWLEVHHSGWLELCMSKWMRNASVPLVEVELQELFYNGWLRWQQHCAGRQVSAGASNSVQVSPRSA